MFLILLLISHLPIHQLEYEDNIGNADFNFEEIVKCPLYQRSISEGLNYNYYGYLPFWVSVSTYINFRYNLLTHIAYFSVEVNEDGSLGQIPNPSRFSEIINQAHPRGVRIHMTFTLFGNSSVTNFLNNSTARGNALQNISSFLNVHEIEGVNIDFEFVTSAVRDSFSLFITELSDELHCHPTGRNEVYLAIPTVPSWYPGYDFSLLSDISDGLFMMGYGYHYSGSGTAGPNAPTFNSSFWGYYAINTSVGDFIDSFGVSPDKLILGMPYFGFDWPTVSEYIGSSTTGSGSPVTFSNAKVNASIHGREWDSFSATPWYNYYSDQWHQCWFDDSASIRLKLNITSDSSLQGAGCWALGYDGLENDLWVVIEHVLWIEPPENHFVVEVLIPDLNVREGPSTIYPIISEVYQGERFISFSYSDNWYKIYYPSGSGPYYAWINGGDGTNNQYLKGVTGDSALKVTASLLNIRAGPSTDSTVITVITEGQVFIPVNFVDNWTKIILPDTNHSGWCYYQPYTSWIINPENYNTYHSYIDSINYPDTVTSSDTFTVNIFIRNTGWVPLDSNVHLKTDNSSLFYYHPLWIDSLNAGTDGFDGLPNQKFLRTSIFYAPVIQDTILISESFYLSAHDSGFSNIVDVNITVLGSPTYTQEEDNENEIYFYVQNSIFFNFCTFISRGNNNYNLRIFDLSGRCIYNILTDKDKLNVGFDFPNGLYYFIYNSGSITKQGKILKLI